MNNKLNNNILQATVNDLKNNPNSCTTTGIMVSTNELSDTPKSIPSEQLSKFINYFVKSNLIDYQYLENSKKIANKQIEEYTFDEVLTNITTIIIGDKLSSGYLYCNVKDGTLLKLLERLISLNNDDTNNPQETFLNITSDMARIINYRMHAEQLDIPVLNNFRIENNEDPQTILLAVGNGFTEQLTSDGFIEDGEFEHRIELVINNTKQFMSISGCENADNSFIYYKDYDNGVFNFKIYVCDMIISIGNEKKIIRQFIAYFVENKMQDFYQLSLSAGPFTMPTEQLKVGIIDLNNDMVTKSLDKLMTDILDNLKYKKEGVINE